MTPLNENDLETIKNKVIDVVLEAGKGVLEGFNKHLDYNMKGGCPSDLVTEYDKRCELYLKDNLSPKFDYFYGEETTGSLSGLPEGTGWVVDPIDGTTNFIHGLEAFGISVGLVQNGQSIIGIIYAPALKQLFCAIKGISIPSLSFHQFVGKGAYLIDVENHKLVPESMKRLSIQNKEHIRLGTSLVTVEFGGFRANPSRVTQGLGELSSLLLLPVHGIRKGGSATINIMQVALGKIDVYYERGLNPWDVAAGYLIAAESGCLVSGIIDREYSMKRAEIIITVNNETLCELRTLLNIKY
jgi:myo-inositol-1(or 4)-monophosphatase